MTAQDLPPCEYCGHAIPASADRCPHCGRPGLFPNVRMAELPAEVDALKTRYQAARAAAATKSNGGALADFETAVLGAGVSIARPLTELLRLASSENELYASYYQLIEAGVRLPKGDKWDSLRGVADSALFPGYRQQIKFAALTLDDQGLSNYGECSIFFKESMIAHRASMFEENSVLFVIRKDVSMKDASNLPMGFRASWAERASLCVAKLADRLTSSTTRDQFPAVLMKQGDTSDDDEFVEVHIFGPLTVRSIERVTFFSQAGGNPLFGAVKEKLQQFNIEVREWTR